MSQVIMMLLFPIGLYFYFFKERPARPAYYKIFTDFEKEVQENNALTDTQKIQHFKEMLVKNDYKIVEQTDNSVTGEKRIFSMSLLAMGLGLYFIGAVVYLFYYYVLQKPHVVEFKV